MRPWTSYALCEIAKRLLSHRPGLASLDPGEPIERVLERINALAPDEPRVMMFNARVETDLGLVAERLAEGAVPPEGDDGFQPSFRLIYGRLGSKICLLPHFPQEMPEVQEYRLRIAAILENLEDGTHPNIRRAVAVPADGTRTYATVTFYQETDGTREFARFSWRKDLREADAVWLLKDSWTRLRSKQVFGSRRPSLPS